MVDSQTEFKIIRSILTKVNTPLSAEEILSFAVQGIKDEFGCLAAAIIAVDSRREYFRVVNAKGWSHEFIKHFHTRPFSGLVADMAGSEQTIRIRAGDERFMADGYVFEHDYQDLLAAPMGIRGKKIGFLALSSDRADAFSSEDEKALGELANLCTLILDHGSLGDQVLSLSNIDPLTGLYSYKFWHEELHREITRSELQDLPVSLMDITINKFKEYNSMFGHVRGDELLITVSEIIRSELDVLDVPCRVGSKWHVVLVGREEGKSEQVASQLLRRMEEQPPAVDGAVTLSIGLSAYQKGEGEKALIARVEDALLEARRQGGNALHVK